MTDDHSPFALVDQVGCGAELERRCPVWANREQGERVTLPVRVAVGALLEVGRPDLAARLSPNKRGFPTLTGSGLRFGDGSMDRLSERILANAFLIGHRVVHPEARRSVDSFGDFGMSCDTCEWQRVQRQREGN